MKKNKLIRYFFFMFILIQTFNITHIYANYIDYNVDLMKENFNTLDLNQFKDMFTKEEKEVIEYYKNNPLIIGYIKPQNLHSVNSKATPESDMYLIYVLERLLGLDIRIEPINLSRQKITDILANGYVDMIVGVYKNELPSAYPFNVTPPYDIESVYLYSNEYDGHVYINDLDDKKIGMINGQRYIRDKDVDYLNSIDINIQPVFFDSYDDAISSLQNNEIDYFYEKYNQSFIDSGFYLNTLINNQVSKLKVVAFNSESRNVPLYSAISKIITSDNFINNVNDYNYLVRQEIVKSPYYFTLEERNFIEFTKNNPIVIKNIDNYTDIRTYSHEYNILKDTITEIWENIIDLTSLGVSYSTSNNDSLLDIEKALGKYGNATADLTFSLYDLNDNNAENYVDFIDFDIPIPIVFLGKYEDPKITKNTDLSNYKVGVIKNSIINMILSDNLPDTYIDNSYQTFNQLVSALIDDDIELLATKNIVLSDYNNNIKLYNLFIKYIYKFNIDIRSAVSLQYEHKDLLERVIYKSLFAINTTDILYNHINNIPIIDPVIDNMINNRHFITGTYIILTFVTCCFIYSLSKIDMYIKKLEKIAYYDELTGLPNKRSFLQDVNNKRVHIFFISLKNFRQFNDLHGNKTSDYYLYKITKRISSLLTTNEKLYLFSNDKLIITSSNPYNEEVAKESAVTIKSVIYDNVYIDDIKVNSNCSVAIYKDNSQKDDIDVILAKLNMGIKKANENLNGIAIIDNKEYDVYKKNILIESIVTIDTIEEAIKPAYQPKHNTLTGEVVGAETLARWDHPSTGPLFPDTFIPLLENRRDIDLLDIIVLKKSCKDFSNWIENGLVSDDFKLSFNFSMITIQKNDIIKIFNDIHKEYNLPYHRLDMEITETMFFEDLDDINKKVLAVSALGVHVSLDDFSSGSANIGQLAKLQVDTIKVDKGILNSGMNNTTEQIFNNISDLCKRLEINMLVEGVETEEEIQFLKKLNIYYVQGYYYAPPLSASQFEEHLNKYS